MVDYVALLRKTIDGLPNNSPEIRGRVYNKARQTVDQKLAAINPAPPQAAVDKQRDALEAAIEEVEQFYAPPPEPETIFEPELEPEPAFEPEPEAAPVAAPLPKTNHADPLDFLNDPPADDPASYEDSAGNFDDLMSVTSEPVEAPKDPFAEIKTKRDAPKIEPQKPADDMMAMDAPTPNPEGKKLSDRAAELQAGAALGGVGVAMPKRAGKPKAKGSNKGLVWGALGLIAVIGVGALVWTQKDMIAQTTGIMLPGATEPDLVPMPTPDPVDQAEVPANDTPAPVAPTESDTGTKFTQRLLPNGEEMETGPSVSDNQAAGSSQAATTPSQNVVPGDGVTDPQAETTDAPEDLAEDAAPQTLAVGQTAIFYEEQTGTNSGSALRGFVVWSKDTEPSDDGQSVESIIRGELSIPEKDLNVMMTIRENNDQTLPASHIIELVVQTPEDFDGGTIDDVQRITLKATEQAAGQALIGAPVKIAEGFFLIALDNAEAALAANVNALKQGQWLDIPVVYKTGRRALLSFEKGIPGEEVFNDVFADWEAN